MWKNDLASPWLFECQKRIDYTLDLYFELCLYSWIFLPFHQIIIRARVHLEIKQWVPEHGILTCRVCWILQQHFRRLKNVLTCPTPLPKVGGISRRELCLSFRHSFQTTSLLVFRHLLSWKRKEKTGSHLLVLTAETGGYG